MSSNNFWVVSFRPSNVGHPFLFLKPLSGGPKKQQFLGEDFSGMPKRLDHGTGSPRKMFPAGSPKNQPIEKEHDRNQTIMTSGSSR